MMYLTQALHRSVQNTPDATMVVFGDRERSFREVADRVSRLAGALRALGVRDDDRVAILAYNSDRYFEYLFAVPWANAVLNPVNIRWSTAEIAFSLADSDSRVILVDDAFISMLPGVRSLFPQLHTVIYIGDGPCPAGALSYEELIQSAEPMEDTRRGGDQVAGLFYTGGTTGYPKGVMLSHANLITASLGAISSGYVFRSRSRILHITPMFHIAALSGVVPVSILGGTHVILPAFEPVAVMTAIERYQISHVLLVSVMIQALIDHPSLPDYELSSVEAVLYGASPIAQRMLEQAMKVLPNAAFTQAYAMTELSPTGTLLGPEDHRKEELLRSAGRAAPHVEVRIVDDQDNELPRGTVGEVTVRGGNVMLGYWNRPEETADAVRNGWMHTGDAAYMDDAGYVFIVDRIKDMIVTGGENVYSVEVEKALLLHPAVSQCAVIGVPDETWGERVHAVVVAAPGERPSPEVLRAHAKTLIAGYKAPRTVEFVDELPISAAGKILKSEFRKKYWRNSDRNIN